MDYIKKLKSLCGLILIPIKNFRSFFMIILLMFFQFFIFSCAYFQVSSQGFSQKNLGFNPEETFYLEPIKIVCFNFIDDEQIAYIMNRKIEFALKGKKHLSLVEKRDRADYSIEPELILKTYQQTYRDKNYYLLLVRIYREKAIVFQYNYEYNGNVSIFDAKIQNLLLKNFLQDFSRCISTHKY